MSAKARDGDAKATPRRPWRDNVEAVTMAIIVAVMLKYFIIEAYKIPTGSMQPTLMGNPETGIFDRILVDKLSYHYREPERFEIAVFKYPLDRSMNYIKRIAGVGPEWLRVHNGDLWHSDRPKNDPPRYETDWTILRRPKNVQRDTWKALDAGAPGCVQWLPLDDASVWEIEEDRIVAKAGGSLKLPRGRRVHGQSTDSFMDDFKDGYPRAVRESLRPRPGVPTHNNEVGDLRFEAEVTPGEDCEEVLIEFREGTRLYSFSLPGPAAAPDKTVTILATDPSRDARSPLARDREANLEEAWKMEAGDTVEFAAENLDDRLALEIDGTEVLSLGIPAAETGQKSNLHLRVIGGGVEFDDVEVFRDIYYTSDTSRVSEWYVEEDHYVMLGDNTQDSSDSREWTFARHHLPGIEGIVAGNYRPQNRLNRILSDGNPLTVPGEPQGSMFFFRDEWGTLHSCLDSEQRKDPLYHVMNSQVPRALITGRALIVFWPLKPSFGLWRLKWVR